MAWSKSKIKTALFVKSLLNAVLAFSRALRAWRARVLGVLTCFMKWRAWRPSKTWRTWRALKYWRA